MKAKPLTRAEKKWVADVNAVLAKCPSKRLTSYTVGGSDVTIYDNSFSRQVDDLTCRTNMEVGQAVYELGAELAIIDFPFTVRSTAG